MVNFSFQEDDVLWNQLKKLTKENFDDRIKSLFRTSQSSFLFAPW